jgi:replication factor A1
MAIALRQSGLKRSKLYIYKKCTQSKGSDILKIADLRKGQGKVNVEVEVVSVGEIREFQKFGRQGKVATAVVKDDSGEINLTLWNEDIDKVSAGSKIKIENGYISEFQGEPQLTAGKFGKLIVL